MKAGGHLSSLVDLEDEVGLAPVPRGGRERVQDELQAPGRARQGTRTNGLGGREPNGLVETVTADRDDIDVAGGSDEVAECHRAGGVDRLEVEVQYLEQPRRQLGKVSLDVGR
jgi:hypothetical protein